MHRYCFIVYRSVLGKVPSTRISDSFPQLGMLPSPWTSKISTITSNSNLTINGQDRLGVRLYVFCRADSVIYRRIARQEETRMLYSTLLVFEI